MSIDLMDQSTWPNQEMEKQGNYLVVDLENPKVVTYQLGQYARVGDNLRTYYFAFKDGLKPHKLYDDSLVTVYGSDAKGKIKILTVKPQTGTEWSAGRVMINFPQAFFQAAGTYRRLLIEVKRGDQIEATVNFKLDVMPNDFAEITLNSTDFWNWLEEIKDQVNNIDNVYLKQLSIGYKGPTGMPFIHGYKYNYGAGIAQPDNAELNSVTQIGVKTEFPDSETVIINVQTQDLMNMYDLTIEEDGSAIYLTNGTDNLAFYIEQGFSFKK